MTRHYLAFDLGAESGRAILGRLESDHLEISELHRFPNMPLQTDDSLRWDIRRLFGEMRRALDLAPENLTSIGVDTWGIDFALLDGDGALRENPFHYRDRRTEGVMEAVCAKIPRERIYAATGIQFLPINTLFQLCATKVPDRAEAFLTIPDLLNYWLTGRQVSEYTNASTTQLLDARTRDWAWDLIAELNLPRHIFRPIIQPGTILGALQSAVSTKLAGVPVIAPACHDTGSAVAAIRMSPRSAFLSSGTWSLFGAELAEPNLTSLAFERNFTNEGGVCGTIRFLKNIAGLWLLQACRNAWSQEGRDFSYDELLRVAAASPALDSIVDPDHPSFLHPPHMPQAIAAYCAETRQQVPQSPPAVARMILESLARKYRDVLESLEQVTKKPFDEIRVVGGGSRNRLLNQLTADATGRRIAAGPVEATALGNIAMQMLATGAVSSLAEARAVIGNSYPAEYFQPR